jgi:hypothetical protein
VLAKRKDHLLNARGSMNSLREVLKNWTNMNRAQHELAKRLGIIDPDASFRETERLWGSDNTTMFHLLCALEDEGLLKCRAEPDLQYKWCGDTVPREVPEGYRLCCKYLVEKDEPCPFCDEGFQ